MHWDDRSGGRSTGIACVVTRDDARSLFVKAVNGSENPFALQLLTREAELSARLPDLPGVPRVLDAGVVPVADDVWWAMITPAAPGGFVQPIRWPETVAALRAHGVDKLWIAGPDAMFSRLRTTADNFDVEMCDPRRALVKPRR